MAWCRLEVSYLGGGHAIYQILGMWFHPKMEKVYKKIHIDTTKSSYKLFQIILTFLLVNFAWIFFRASDLNQAFTLIRRMIVGFSLPVSFAVKHYAQNGWHFGIGLNLVTSDDFLWNHMGITHIDNIILIIALLIIFFVDIVHYHKKIHLRDLVSQQNLPFRWLFYITLLFLTAVLGIYGPGYNASSFIYTNF